MCNCIRELKEDLSDLYKIDPTINDEIVLEDFETLSGKTYTKARIHRQGCNCMTHVTHKYCPYCGKAY